VSCHARPLGTLDVRHVNAAMLHHDSRPKMKITTRAGSELGK
jgi:hypothetical protein